MLLYNVLYLRVRRLRFQCTLFSTPIPGRTAWQSPDRRHSTAPLEPPVVFATGLNYADHVARTGWTPRAPMGGARMGFPHPFPHPCWPQRVLSGLSSGADGFQDHFVSRAVFCEGVRLKFGQREGGCPTFLHSPACSRDTPERPAVPGADR